MEKKTGLFEKLRQGLSKTRGNVFTGLFSSTERVDEAFFEELEEGMILADMGMETAEMLLERLRDVVKAEKITTRTAARDALIRLPEQLPRALHAHAKQVV